MICIHIYIYIAWGTWLIYHINKLISLKALSITVGPLFVTERLINCRGQRFNEQKQHRTQHGHTGGMRGHCLIHWLILIWLILRESNTTAFVFESIIMFADQDSAIEFRVGGGENMYDRCRVWMTPVCWGGRRGWVSDWGSWVTTRRRLVHSHRIEGNEAIHRIPQWLNCINWLLLPLQMPSMTSSACGCQRSVSLPRENDFWWMLSESINSGII